MIINHHNQAANVKIGNLKVNKPHEKISLDTRPERQRKTNIKRRHNYNNIFQT